VVTVFKENTYFYWIYYTKIAVKEMAVKYPLGYLMVHDPNINWDILIRYQIPKFLIGACSEPQNIKAEV